MTAVIKPVIHPAMKIKITQCKWRSQTGCLATARHFARSPGVPLRNKIWPLTSRKTSMGRQERKPSHPTLKQGRPHEHKIIIFLGSYKIWHHWLYKINPEKISHWKIFKPTIPICRLFGLDLVCQVCQSVLASVTLKVYWFDVFGEGRTTHTRYTYARQAQYHLQTGLYDSPVRKVREKVLTASWNTLLLYHILSL